MIRGLCVWMRSFAVTLLLRSCLIVIRQLIYRMPLKTLFQKKEMTNFGYDDDVLLKWEITGTGRCVDRYSHFNSIGNQFYGATIRR